MSWLHLMEQLLRKGVRFLSFIKYHTYFRYDIIISYVVLLYYATVSCELQINLFVQTNEFFLYANIAASHNADSGQHFSVRIANLAARNK